MRVKPTVSGVPVLSVPALTHSEATIGETVDMSAWKAAVEKHYNKPQMSSLGLFAHAVS